MSLQNIDDGANNHVPINENFAVLAGAAVYGYDATTSGGLTRGYIGGRWSGNSIAAGTLSLTNAATNYIVVARSNGAISVSTATTNWDDTDNYARVYKLTTAGSVVTATEDHRFGDYGVHGSIPAVAVATEMGAPGEAAYLTSYQAPDAQRHKYLMGDGTFRDPLRQGLGAFTVGTPATVSDDTKYLAWPSICRMRNGRLIMVYTRGDSHHGDNTGKAVGKISADDGATWGSEFDIYDPPSNWASAVNVSCTSSGRVFVTLFRDVFGDTDSGEAGVVYSDDFGATWSAWIDLSTPSGFTRESFTAGPVIEMPNGDLLVTVEGTDSGDNDPDESVKTVKSTDGGGTWGSAVTVRLYDDDTRPYYESQLVPLPNGDLLCVHRTSDGDGTHYISKSTDSGATWGVPYAAFSGHGRPHTILLSSGTLLCITRQNVGDYVIAFSSRDWGVTWSAEIEVDATPYEMEYGCPVELRNGTVLVVYGYQPTSSATNSDIKQVVVTEDAVRITPEYSRAPRVTSITSDAAPTPNASTTDVYVVTALATAPTFGAPTGTPAPWQPLMIVIEDNGTLRALAWNAAYRATDSALPTTTTAGKPLYVGFIYNPIDSKWDCMGSREVA